ncbi:LuxR C-terminal-related transcriptional regulator [Aeromicrobium sp.]|uniref:LuxR C-terminal-related transcriptional regulator n=1 Tax=Aeromicrobium sp. TaxID=1871063 RepID=UPI002FC65963
MPVGEVVEIMSYGLNVDPLVARSRLAALDPAGPDDRHAAVGFVAVLSADFDIAVEMFGGPPALGESSLSAAVRDYVHAICLSRVPADLGVHRIDLDTPEGSLVAFLMSEAAMVSGQIALAEQIASAVLAMPGAEGGMRTWTRIVRSRALCFLGRLDEAGAECKAVLAETTDRPIANRVARGVDGFLAGHTGRQSELAVFCEDLRGEIPDPRSYADSVAFLLAALAESAAGNPTAAAEVLLYGGGGDGLPLLPLSLQAYGYDVLVESAVALAQIPHAAELLAEFELLPIHEHPMAAAALSRSRARLNLVLEQHADSILESETSAARASAVGGELYVIRAKILRALAEAASGDASGSRRDLDAVASTAALSGSAEVRAWALRELRAVGRHLRQFPALGWDSLNSRQHVVARLAAQGLRNREIAAALYMSEKTVEGHVAAVLEALGTTNRVGIGRELEGDEIDPEFVSKVTPRQREVAMLVARGLSNGAIARSLAISEKTVEKHVGDLFDRLQVHSRSALAARVRRAPADAF